MPEMGGGDGGGVVVVVVGRRAGSALVLCVRSGLLSESGLLLAGGYVDDGCTWWCVGLVG